MQNRFLVDRGRRQAFPLTLMRGKRRVGVSARVAEKWRSCSLLKFKSAIIKRGLLFRHLLHVYVYIYIYKDVPSASIIVIIPVKEFSLRNFFSKWENISDYRHVIVDVFIGTSTARNKPRPTSKMPRCHD